MQFTNKNNVQIINVPIYMDSSIKIPVTLCIRLFRLFHILKNVNLIATKTIKL